MTDRLRGVIPVIPSTLDDAGALDLPSMCAVLDRLVDARVDGVMMLGSGGEIAYLNRDERQRVVATAVERARDTLVVAGVAQYGTAEAVEEARGLEDLGAGALLVALPQYFPTPYASVLRHYDAVTRAVSIPVLFYHYPAVFGLRLDPSQMADLFERVPLSGIKESGLSTPELAAHLRHINRPIRVFTGVCFNLADAVRLGAVGAICPVTTLMPRSARAVIRTAGDDEAAQARLLRALPIVSGAPVPALLARAGLSIGMRVGLPIPQSPGFAHAGLKEALRAIGVISSARVREPQPGLSPRQRRRVAKLAGYLAEL